MKTHKIRRTDKDVIVCGELVSQGLTVLTIEKVTGIPHSTVHWVIMHRLPHLDKGLYEACLSIFCVHKKLGGKRIDRTV